jgi:hypothetical protein
MSFWAIYPSGNSEAAAICARAWRLAGWKVGVLIDADQPDMDCDYLIREPNYRGTAAALNRLMSEIPGWSIVACVNDDMFPSPCEATEAAALIRKLGVGVMQPIGEWFDGMAHSAVSPIITREYATDFQLKPWDEGFYHLYRDTLLRDIAISRGMFAEPKELGIEHRHKSIGHTDTLPPEKRQKNNERHKADWELYQIRKASGFPR